MNIRTIRSLCCAALLTSGTVIVAAGEPETPPEGVLRATLGASYGNGSHSWNSPLPGPQSLTYFGLGAALEYGVTPWAAICAEWLPGVFPYGETEDGKTGLFADPLLGIKLRFIGEKAPASSEKTALSAALALKVSMPSGNGSALEPGSHLWGLGFRLYYGYRFHPLFLLNVSAELVYSPEQKSSNPAFDRQMVNHPLDAVFELEPRFSYPLPGGTALRFGLPLTGEFSPESTIYGAGLNDLRYCFSIGPAFTAAFPFMKFPFEITVQYRPSLAGRNRPALHEVRLLGKVDFRLRRGTRPAEVYVDPQTAP
ncbi:MAG: hypothetical protein LBK27_06860 [Treponema sp.]|jgi:hypothetical protein|nr:hypothetical protein [Treponema sp.]